MNSTFKKITFLIATSWMIFTASLAHAESNPDPVGYFKLGLGSSWITAYSLERSGIAYDSQGQYLQGQSSLNLNGNLNATFGFGIYLSPQSTLEISTQYLTSDIAPASLPYPNGYKLYSTAHFKSQTFSLKMRHYARETHFLRPYILGGLGFLRYAHLIFDKNTTYQSPMTAMMSFGLGFEHPFLHTPWVLTAETVFDMALTHHNTLVMKTSHKSFTDELFPLSYNPISFVAGLSYTF